MTRSRRVVVTSVTILVLGLLSAGVASGIVYGEPDNGSHPHVGSMVVRFQGAGENGEDLYFQWCSGTQMRGKNGKDVFVTAAHCIAAVPSEGEVLVTFDETVTPGASFFTGQVHANPLFGTHGMADLYDVAVIVLDVNTGISQYGVLPTAGLLDQRKDNGSLKNQQFTTVGYGSVRVTKQKSFASILGNESRNKATQSFNSLTKAWINFDMHSGGTCYGDSGGPHFLGNGNVVVSLTVTGDTPCKATDKTYRLDTPNARAFLGQYIDLP